MSVRSSAAAPTSALSASSVSAYFADLRTPLSFAALPVHRLRSMQYFYLAGVWKQHSTAQHSTAQRSAAQRSAYCAQLRHRDSSRVEHLAQLMTPPPCHSCRPCTEAGACTCIRSEPQVYSTVPSSSNLQQQQQLLTLWTSLSQYCPISFVVLPCLCRVPVSCGPEPDGEVRRAVQSVGRLSAQPWN
jgi:hypothetical protein